MPEIMPLVNFIIIIIIIIIEADMMPLVIISILIEAEIMPLVIIIIVLTYIRAEMMYNMLTNNMLGTFWDC